MTTEEKVIKNKLGLLKLAEELGNVSQACRIMGYSRDSFYRFRDLYAEQGMLQADRVVWISDGAAGLWGLFNTQLATHARGVLDFYHAAQNLWRGAKAWLGGRSRQAHRWFRSLRHRLGVVKTGGRRHDRQNEISFRVYEN